MLSRKVCRDCRNKAWGEGNSSEIHDLWGLPASWRCPHAYSTIVNQYVRVKDESNPPRECPYKMEHGMAEALEKSHAE